VLDVLDVGIEYLNAAGDGVAHIGRRTLLVPFTIPGERVRVEVDRRARDASTIPARLLEVLSASPHRVVPGCRHFGIDERRLDAQGERGCGGCSWQHIAYPEQLRLKTALVHRLLNEALRRSPPVKPTLPGTPGKPWGYRNKVHFVFGNAASSRRPGHLLLGHYARGSRRIVPVEECPVHADGGNRVAFAFFDAFRRAGVTAATSARTGRTREAAAGVLRGIAVRVASGGPDVMATLVVSNDRDARLRSASRRAMNTNDAPTGLHLNVHPRGDAFIFGRETRTLAGPARLREQVAGTSFLVSPTAFFQTNVHAAGLLVELVLDAIPEGERVLDLYAGAGLFALPLARRGHTVLAVEENRAAVADGEASARLNRLAPQQCQFVARPVESALATIQAAEAVVMDPPREGCGAGVIDDIFGRLRPRRVVYVSCNPEALARDLRAASSFRYAIQTVQPVDMFPHTAHVETVVTLERSRHS
jgi:23S rRNA (uracil1939-C5)-methyltransferase